MTFFFNESPELTPLTRNEKLLPEAKYYYAPIKRPPAEIMESIGDNNAMDFETAFRPKDIMTIIEKETLPYQRGWCFFPEGGAYSCGTTPFPGGKPEMLSWWFSWFCIDSFRQKLWCPEHHQGQAVPVSTINRLRDYSLSPKERCIGTSWFGLDTGMSGKPGSYPGIAKVAIVDESEFGLDKQKILESGCETICMYQYNVGETAPRCSWIHIAKPTDYGFELRSHFWFGWHFVSGNPVLSDVKFDKSVLESMCRNQTYHLLDEYYRLSGILPDIYNEFKDCED